ncbi:LuxR C-terminal-related transcriptional regulator [beta proteobacterium MWH-UniP1]
MAKPILWDRCKHRGSISSTSTAEISFDFVKTVEIFLVEPDEENRAYLQGVFAQTGFFVKPFNTSEQMLIHLMRYPTHLGCCRCVVLNEHQLGISGLDAQVQVRKLEPNLQVIFYSYQASVESVIHAWKNGAASFFPHPFDANELVAAVRSCLSQGRASPTADNQAEIEVLRASYATLTSREREVLLLISKGRKNQEIGSDLGLSIPTVKMHRANLMRKLELDNIAQLINFYHRCSKFLSG